MKDKKPRLGRGLDALLGSGSALGEPSVGDKLQTLPIEQLKRGRYQPRTRMDTDALRDLADSIRAQGVVQPILVRPAGEGFEIIAGERRWRASQLAGLESVPAIVREIPDEVAMAVALIENIQREGLSAIEEAQGLRRLQDEFGLTHQDIAERIGRSRAAVTNLLRLLSLNADVRAMLEEGQLEMGHGRALLTLTSVDQLALARQVAAKGLSVRETERRAKTYGQARPAPPTVDPDVAALEQRLGEQLGARVRIQTKKTGTGSIIIDYYSMDELEGLIGRFSA